MNRQEKRKRPIATLQKSSVALNRPVALLGSAVSKRPNKDTASLPSIVCSSEGIHNMIMIINPHRIVKLLAFHSSDAQYNSFWRSKKIENKTALLNTKAVNIEIGPRQGLLTQCLPGFPARLRRLCQGLLLFVFAGMRPALYSFAPRCPAEPKTIGLVDLPMAFQVLLFPGHFKLAAVVFQGGDHAETFP